MFTTIWSQLMEQLVGVLRNEKLSAATVILVIFGAYWAYGWAGEEFVKQDDFKQLKSLMITHVEDMQITTASQLIRDKQLQLQLAHATGESESQIAHIEQEIEDAIEYRSCLIKKAPNCKHLKPPE